MNRSKAYLITRALSHFLALIAALDDLGCLRQLVAAAQITRKVLRLNIRQLVERPAALSQLFKTTPKRKDPPSCVS